MAQVDYYQIEELLSEEERLVRDTARRFVDEEFLPRVKLCFREGSFPTGTDPSFGPAGLFRHYPADAVWLRWTKQRVLRLGQSRAGARR